MTSFSPVHIWASMSLLSKIIASGLLLMALASLAVVIERTIALARGSAQSRKFAGEANPLIDRWDFGALQAAGERYKGSPLARVVATASRTFMKRHSEKDGSLSAVELARREVARQMEAVGADLRRGLSVLSSVGSVAPFVGLLGTVVGIISAFQGIAATGSGGLGAVSAGIAEALVETALGLMVAIPSVLFYNYLTVKITSVESALNRSAGELLDQMENEHGSHAERIRPAKAA